MFSRAYTIARKYTLPIVLVGRKFSGELVGSISTCVLINKDGWVVTARHVVEHLASIDRSKSEYDRLMKQVQVLEANPALSRGKKKKLKIDADMITNWAHVWGAGSRRADAVLLHPRLDLAAAQLSPPDPSWTDSFAHFRDPSKPLEPGTSLCRLGFPFIDVGDTISFDEEKQKFDLSLGPPPLFPIEGICTRFIRTEEDGEAYIETSSPGLRGQSGGPIFDVSGAVWGIQSRTMHFPLDFDQTVKRGDKIRSTENAFLHVGWGVHVARILEFLDEKGIEYSLAE